VLHQAQTEARAIVETSRREGEQILAEQRRLATVRAQEAMREQDRLKDQIRRLEERRRQVLESLEPLISQLTNMMPATGGDPRNVVQLQRPSKG
jgi:cell division septum initiation protein DivIVA